ncbi:E3 ubiquitin-protein ligase HERC2-like [Chionomys nivalis]|uniref:E3 ubiquitin-protein ligase HERC2-like n=1 Tax=Chionomys nivalis TaxID=269649 RepID=UPI002594C4E4|nr:E3 ubiquitin-protein ligase HERC2-like [Chionomys nivalis]
MRSKKRGGITRADCVLRTRDKARIPKCSPQSLSGVVALETVNSFRVRSRKGRVRASVRAQESRLPASAVGCRSAKEAEVEGREGRAGLRREPIGRGRPVASRYWPGAVVRQPALRAADRIAGSLASAGSRREGSRSRLAERAAPRLAERGPEQGGAADDGRRQARPPGGNMPSESFCLAAQSRLNSKWLKTDIQLAFTRDGLCGLWNEMVKDGEIVYTGTELTQNRELPSRKDDGADTQNGTKKEDLTDKEKKEEEEMPAPVYKVKSILESWVWGKQPDVNELKECLSVLVKEQQALAVQSATTTLSALRLKQRLVILERYFIALNRTVFQENVKVKWKSSSISVPPTEKKSSRPTGRGVEGLARVGSRAALSFAFAFLRRAWRSGEDADLCSELLQESLDALQALLEASLFGESTVSIICVVGGGRESHEVPQICCDWGCSWNTRD